MAYRNNNNQNDEQALALKTEIQKPRLPLPALLAKRHDLSESSWRVFIDTVWPGATSVDGVALALDYCKARNLDPFKRPVHVVPIYNSALNRQVESVWPGISEIRTTAMRTGVYAGCDDTVFGPPLTQAFKDKQKRGRGDNKYEESAECPEMTFPSWAQVTVYRMVQGVRVPFVGPKTFWLESYGQNKGLNVPNSMWQRRAYGQLDKCAEAAALRKAFPEELGDIYAAEEIEGQAMRGIANRAEGVATAEYSEVDEGSEETKKQPTRDDVRQQAAEPDEFQEYLDHIQLQCDRTGSLQGIEAGYAAESRTWGTMTKEQRDKCEAVFDAARDRLAPPDDGKKEGSADQGKDEDEEDPQQRRYVDALPERLLSRTSHQDVDEFEEMESTVFAQLSPRLLREAEGHIADCRATIDAERDIRGEIDE